MEPRKLDHRGQPRGSMVIPSHKAVCMCGGWGALQGLVPGKMLMWEDQEGQPLGDQKQHTLLTWSLRPADVRGCLLYRRTPAFQGSHLARRQHSRPAQGRVQGRWAAGGAVGGLQAGSWGSSGSSRATRPLKQWLLQRCLGWRR